MSNLNLPSRSLLFAPMEGVTDSLFRQFISSTYPEWDFIACDFLRLPSQGHFSKNHLIEHIGRDNYNNPALLQKTIYQILTSDHEQNAFHIESLNDLGLPWIDLNVGCPSKTVCSHFGGSYLLSDPIKLKKILLTIRNHFKKTFTVKMRVGFQDDQSLENLIKLINDCGVEAITLHGRTRVQLYKGVSNWKYIKQAVKWSQVPLIGNGDVWSPAAMRDFFDYTNCHALMLARSALKSPWLARWFKNSHEFNSFNEFSYHYKNELGDYVKNFKEFMEHHQTPEAIIVKRLKSISRYYFDEIPFSREQKKAFLMAEQTQPMLDVINNL